MPLDDAARARGRAKAAANRALKKAAKQAGAIPNVPMQRQAPVQPQVRIEDDPLFDVEDAPEDLFPTEEDGVLAKVFKKLGLKGESNEEKEYKAVPSAKLTKAQQSLYDSFAPLAIQAFIVVAGWSWSLLDKEYGEVLAPSEEVAEKIIAPLMRIYARSSEIGTSLNPNHIDGAASMAALIGYVWSSYSAYKLLKQEKAENEPGITASHNGPRPLNANQSRHGSEDDGRDANRAASSVRRATAQSNGNGQPGVDLSSLSESERRAYEKLSVLRERDYQSRARRSGVS